MMKRSILTLLVLVTAAGCSDSEREAPAETNVAEEPTLPPATASPSPVAKPSPTAEPGADANVAAIELPPSEEVGPDEQMLDDASATGMTARAERDQEEATEPAPANSEEQ